MKITDAIFYTDNTTVRLETEKGNFYLTNKSKLYDMHPINVMANEISGSLCSTLKLAVKNGKFKNQKEVKEWI